MKLLIGIVIGLILAQVEAHYFNVVTSEKQIEVFCESGVRITYTNADLNRVSISNSMNRVTLTDYALGEATIVLGNCGVFKYEP